MSSVFIGIGASRGFWDYILWDKNVFISIFSSHKLQASKLDTISRSCVYQDFLTTYTTSVLPWVLLGITVINSLIHVGINSTSNRQLIIDYMPSALDTEYKVVGGGKHCCDEVYILVKEGKGN